MVIKAALFGGFIFPNVGVQRSPTVREDQSALGGRRYHKSLVL